jgi:succinylarginine dihydrolase
MKQQYFEVQCDGLIGASHNYSGLSFGNVASTNNEGGISRPKLAALQGLEKMRFVHDLGVAQLVLPPPVRPNFQYALQMGLDLTDGATYSDLTSIKAEIIRACWSASSMWAANAATVSPSLNCDDAQTHVTPANLANSLHRSQEAYERYSLFSKIFVNVEKLQLHKPLPACAILSDEGAANHMYLKSPHDDLAGIEIFVYGKDDNAPTLLKFPARQSRKAFELIAMQHKLPKDCAIFVQQHPSAIDAGVFHNDVIAMSNANVLLYHELSFADEASFLHELKQKARFDLQIIRISSDELPIQEAVESYFYNSQLLSLPNGENCIIAPLEAKNNVKAYEAFQRILIDTNNNINHLHFIDVRESMKNGGGPACLRLRVMMNDAQLAAIPPEYHLTQSNYEKIGDFINDNYPEEITTDMLFNAQFAKQIADISTTLLQLF